MVENVEILEELLLEMKIKYHFQKKDEFIKIKYEDLCQLLIEYTKVIKRSE